jgi:hypothetical protein
MSTHTIPKAHQYTINNIDGTYFSYTYNNVIYTDINVDLTKLTKPTLQQLANFLNIADAKYMKKQELLDRVSELLIFEH